MTDQQRWCSIDGKSWTTVVNDITAIVWLDEDEKTYKTNLWWPNSDSAFAGDYDCIKKAKEACLEAIEHVDDFEYVSRESDPTIDDGMPA